MTKEAGDGEERGEDAPRRTTRCEWCRRVLPEQTRGRPRKYCSQACRQWHWVGRQRAAEIQLGEDELIVTTAELDAIHDELYVLACAVDDAERDLEALGDLETSSPEAKELRQVVEWLLDAARPLRARELRTDDQAG